MNAKPLILVDVDGVLNPSFSAEQKRKLAYHHGWIKRGAYVDGYYYRLFLNPVHGKMLNLLAEETGAELAWGTTWEDHANWAIGPKIGLPKLPVANIGVKHNCKAFGIIPWIAGRTFVWFDDDPEISIVCRKFCAQSHVVIQVDEHTGLLENHIELAKNWLLNNHVPRGT